MFEADAVGQVEQCKTALDLVCFGHALEDVLDRDALALARQVVGDSEDRPEIVGRVVPQRLVASCVKAGTTKNAAALSAILQRENHRFSTRGLGKRQGV